MTEQAPAIHRLKIKIGGSEFEAEGSESSVQAQYQAFLAALASSPAPAHESQVASPPDERKPPADQPTPPGLMERTFLRDGDGLSLNMLPSTERRNADTILLLMWGYSVVLGRPTVTGVELMEAAKQSGLRIDRIDRVVAPNAAYYNRGGSGKGTKYTINNQGKARCRELLAEMTGE